MNQSMLVNIRRQFPWACYVRESVHVEDASMTVWYEVSPDGQAHRPAWGEFQAPTPELIETWTRETMQVMVEEIQRSSR